MNTSNLNLPLMAAAQAQKHVTHNEALLILDAVSQLSIVTRTHSAPPTLVEGEAFIIGNAPTGIWANKANSLAIVRSGVWFYLPPKEGFIAYLQDEAKLVIFDGAAWVDLPAPSAAHTHAISEVLNLQDTLDDKAESLHSHVINEITGLQTELASKATTNHTHDELQNMTLIGLGTTANASNPLSAKLNTALFTAKTVAESGTGDLRITQNKEAAAKTLSYIFQTNWSGRAEFGLIGSDNFSLKVSPDGSNWLESFSVDKTTGAVTFAKSVQQTQIDVFIASGTYSIPPWAKRIIGICIGGGGGGGSGMRGAASSGRGGGGGGGAGARSQEEWLVSELPTALTLTVGQGGNGGALISLDNTVGQIGNDGTPSVVVASGGEILRGAGGKAGGGGTATGGLVSAAIYSSHSPSNGGGSSSLTLAGAAGVFSSQGNGPGGGGGGGSISIANVVQMGGYGGYGYVAGFNGREAVRGNFGIAQTAGGNGGNKAWQRGAGGGGGGGGGGDLAGTVTGGSGGNGGICGGGGGGGGASTNGANSGAGGSGARGEIWILAIG